MPQVEIDYKQIRRRVDKELAYQKRIMRATFFGINLMLFILFTIIAWGMYINAGGPPIEPNIPGVSTTDPIAGAMIMLTTMGGLGVLFQFISLIVDTKLGEAQMRERAVGRILGEELLRLGADEEEETPREKAKRMMRLSDEGELEEITDEEVLLMADEIEQLKQHKG